MTSAAVLSHYSNAVTYVMESKDLSDNYFILLKNAFTPLRFYLACRVCNELLEDPMTPDHTACQHTVCFQCMGGKMKLRPSCGWCQSYENFKPNKSLHALVISYSKLCEYTLSSALYKQQLNHQISDATAKVELAKIKKTVAGLLLEGSQYSFQYRPATDCATGKTGTAANNSVVSTITTEPADARPGIKLTIRNPFKGKSGAKPSASAPERQKRGSSLNLAPASDGPAAADLNLTPVSSDKSKGMIRKVGSASQSEEEVFNVDIEIPKKRSKTVEKKGCGCGNASATPGKLTCYGQRCPCYSNHNPCLDCRCKGCRNPNKFVKIEKSSEDTDNEINVE